jgi:hypothetical protein
MHQYHHAVFKRRGIHNSEQPALPSPGFYPEISGFFEEKKIFLGFLLKKVNLGIFWGFLRKGSSKFRN